MTAWGKLIATTGSLANTVGRDQPFRYRGYVYDTETGWYYLQSRYYDPTLGRFISADVLLSTGRGVIGHNAFAYCLNTPCNGLDSNGHSLKPFTVAVEDGATLFGVSGFTSSSSGEGGGIAAFPPIDLSIIKKKAKDFIELLAEAIAINSIIDSLSDSSSKSDYQNPAVYYGAYVDNNSLRLLTGPMTYSNAKIWAFTIGASKEIFEGNQLNSIGPRRKRGLYTQLYDDAVVIAYDLGGGQPIGPEISSVPGALYHFHVNGRDFMGYYSHFHIWYGSPSF